MKLYFKSWLWGCLLIFIGVQSMDASEQPLKQDWVNIHDQIKGIEAAFPRHPIHMQFDISLKEKKHTGKLEVYSVALNKATLMLTTITSPDLTETILEPSQFKNIFYSVIIQRMFYYPRKFQDHQVFKQEKIVYQGQPALSFSFSYHDKGMPQSLSGLAILQNQRLYILFYLAAKQDFQQETAQKFLHSFQFLKNEND